MIDLTTKRGLPNVVMINGSPYSIYTDFRVWMRFEIELSKLKPGMSMDVSYLFKNDMPSYCNFSELLEFCRPHNELPRSTKHTNAIVLDYELDADYIYAAFLSQYGIDLCEIEDLHWHKFLALFKGLRDEKICDIMSYRCYEPSNEKKDVYAELKTAWEVERISLEKQAEIDKFSSYFE
jgi:hypothetical protein